MSTMTVRAVQLPEKEATVLRQVAALEDRDLLDVALARLYAAGYPYSAMGRTLGRTREAIRQRIEKVDPSTYRDVVRTIHRPKAEPVPPNPYGAPNRRTVYDVPEDILIRLHTLKGTAAQNRRGTKPDAPAARASREMDELLSHAHVNLGIGVPGLAKALGWTQRGVRIRIERAQAQAEEMA